MKKWLPITILACCPNTFAIDQAVLTALLEDVRAEIKMPGLRAAVRLADGRIVYAAVGLADVEANKALDNSVGMPGGSTGKTFVAALIMLLVEDGTLSLDDSVSKWLGDTSWCNRLPNADEICIRHLLSHTAGIADYSDTTRAKFAAVWRVLRRGSFAQMLDAGWQNPETPGSHYGFGLFVYDGGKSFGHGGLWPGYRTHVVHYVPTGTTIAV